MIPKKIVTVVLIGAGGVGKSTLINALANYLHFRNFKEAAIGGPLCRILIQFVLTELCEDDTVAQEVVMMRNYGHEMDDLDGMLHHFDYDENTVLRLAELSIIVEDASARNVEQFQRFFQKCGTIHAICLCVKPNEERLTVDFLAALRQFVGNLPPSMSAANLFVCFTHSRSTLYKPGDTFGALQTFFADERLPFTLSADNVFCVENDSFRVLCALSQSYALIQLDTMEVSAIEDGWTRSAAEIHRMVRCAAALQPLQTKNDCFPVCFGLFVATGIGYCAFRIVKWCLQRQSAPEQ